MQSLQPEVTTRYAKAIEFSKRIRWDIERDVIRSRSFDFAKKFLPDGLSKAAEFGFLSANERRLVSQIQGRTYANMFGLVERYIGAKTLELSKDYWLGDQVALEALVRFTGEEIKHQELFRRLEEMAAAGMPAGYKFKLDPNQVAGAVLSKSTWAVLGLTLDIEIFTQAHYRSSIETDANLSELWKDVFLYHWKEESQHAIMDELEWRREDAKLTGAERDRAVDDLIALVAAIDGMLHVQAKADAEYFIRAAGRPYEASEHAAIDETLLKAYRWQYIVSGVQEPRFMEVLKSLVTKQQLDRIVIALTPILEHVAS
jgi:DNA-binding Lrp family transcriptional regulator